MKQATPSTSERGAILHGEELVVSRREIEGATTHVNIVTRERDETVDELLTHTRVEVERVAVGKLVDAMPTTRQEGDVTILPVVEEVVVVTRRLRLKEEIHIRCVLDHERHRETVPLREQDAIVTRTEVDPTGTASNDGVG